MTFFFTAEVTEYLNNKLQICIKCTFYWPVLLLNIIYMYKYKMLTIYPIIVLGLYCFFLMLLSLCDIFLIILFLLLSTGENKFLWTQSFHINGRDDGVRLILRLPLPLFLFFFLTAQFTRCLSAGPGLQPGDEYLKIFFDLYLCHHS